MHEINKLDQQVINQIAAGEVVERPASVVKELIENAIDAGATQVNVSLYEGGLEKIEVKDNGKGISREDLPNAFERYATSKLVTTEDLEAITTYGFRGEALAAISSVSKTTILTNKNDEGSEMTSNNGEFSEITPGSRSQGTTITIENLFSTIPARLKYLKSADTEYKYILKVFTHFALLNGKVHFILTHNNKEIYNLPQSETEELPRERVARIYSINPNELLAISHEEYGIKINGYIVHPKLLGGNSKFLVSFVNSRPVEDKGIYRSVQQGIAEYVPDFFKPSGIVAIKIPSDQVDVNVHPRKTEVKLINPFRVYAAVTHAVKLSLQSNVTEPVHQLKNTPNPAEIQNSKHTDWDNKQNNAYNRLRGSQPQFFFDGTRTNATVPLSSTYDSVHNEASGNEAHLPSRIPEYQVEQAKQSMSEAEVLPILGRYIIVGFIDEVWIVDQHAAAERVRYEQFKQAYLDGVALSQQRLLTPLELPLTEEELLVLSMHITVLNRLGFAAEIIGNKLSISTIPTYLQRANLEMLLRDTISEFVEHDALFLTPIIEDFSSEKNLSLIIATMACHNSVRMNERLSIPEAKSIISSLLDCKVPYACPHGRRIVWRMSKEEVDRQFMR